MCQTRSRRRVIGLEPTENFSFASLAAYGLEGGLGDFSPEDSPTFWLKNSGGIDDPRGRIGRAGCSPAVQLDLAGAFRQETLRQLLERSAKKWCFLLIPTKSCFQSFSA